MQCANVTEAWISQQIQQSDMTQDGLAQLSLKIKTKQSLQVRDGDAGRLAVAMRRKQVLQKSSHIFPRNRRARLLTGRRLQNSTLLLHPTLRMLVRNKISFTVAKQSPLSNRNLHDMANL